MKPIIKISVVTVENGTDVTRANINTTNPGHAVRFLMNAIYGRKEEQIGKEPSYRDTDTKGGK